MSDRSPAQRALRLFIAPFHYAVLTKKKAYVQQEEKNHAFITNDKEKKKFEKE